MQIEPDGDDDNDFEDEEDEGEEEAPKLVKKPDAGKKK